MAWLILQYGLGNRVTLSVDTKIIAMIHLYYSKYTITNIAVLLFFRNFLTESPGKSPENMWMQLEHRWRQHNKQKQKSICSRRFIRVPSCRIARRTWPLASISTTVELYKSLWKASLRNFHRLRLLLADRDKWATLDVHSTYKKNCQILVADGTRSVSASAEQKL